MHDSLLAFIRRFVALAPAEEDLLRQWFVPETLPKGKFFLRPGVLRYFQSRDGQELTYYFGREQEFIGDYDATGGVPTSGARQQALDRGSMPGHHPTQCTRLAGALGQCTYPPSRDLTIAVATLEQFQSQCTL